MSVYIDFVKKKKLYLLMLIPNSGIKKKKKFKGFLKKILKM